MPKYYFYTRASTKNQPESIATQELALQQAVKGPLAWRLREHEFGRTFCDNCTSGSIPLYMRPDGEELLRTVERGDVVIITELSRMFRNIEDCSATTRWFADELDVGVIILANNNLDTRNHDDRMMLTMLGMVAEMQRENSRSLQMDRLEARRMNGMFHSRPTIGWKVVPTVMPDGTTENIASVDTVQRAKITALYEAHKASGLSVEAFLLKTQQKCNKYNTPHEKNPLYKPWNKGRSRGLFWTKTQLRTAFLAHEKGYPIESVVHDEAYTRRMRAQQKKTGSGFLGQLLAARSIRSSSGAPSLPPRDSSSCSQQPRPQAPSEELDEQKEHLAPSHSL